MIFIILACHLCTADPDVKMVRRNGVNRLEQISEEPPTSEAILESLYLLEVSHPDIVFRQILLETGHLTSHAFKQKNNLTGFMARGRIKGYRRWIDSIMAYKEWQDRHYDGGDYYKFLEEIGYAEDPMYTYKLKHIKCTVESINVIL